MRMINLVSHWCINRNYISEEQIPWLEYILEKKITTSISMTAMLIVGLCVSLWGRTVCFLAGFSAIRCRTNGFHARTHMGCFLVSIGLEVFFLMMLPDLLSLTVLMILLSVSSVLIFFFAPYNHPNMHLSCTEVRECAKSAKRRLCALLFAIFVLHISSYSEETLGIVLGIIMASFLLILAYILDYGGGFNAEEQNRG